MDIQEIMLTRLEYLQKEKQRLEKKIAAAPEGFLTCHRRESSYKWYQNFPDRKKIYIPQKNIDLAGQLAVKTYERQNYLDVCQELNAINAYLRKCCPKPGRADRLLQRSAGIRELLEPIIRSLPEELMEWENAPYDKCGRHPEHLTIPGARGEMMRSKSEAIISFVLYSKGIPYRYECGLELPDGTFYPDFTARHPLNGEIYIWEHFGLLDDPDYLEKMLWKLRIYINNGWIPGHRLIITTETKDQVLDINTIPDIIRQYFQI